LHAELTKPMLAAADVAPALRRAILAADAAIATLAEVATVDMRAVGYAGPSTRRNLAGIGASVVAAVLIEGLVFLGHVGENSAVVVRGGNMLRLSQEHVVATYRPSARWSRTGRSSKSSPMWSTRWWDAPERSRRT